MNLKINQAPSLNCNKIIKLSVFDFFSKAHCGNRHIWEPSAHQRSRDGLLHLHEQEGEAHWQGKEKHGPHGSDPHCNWGQMSMAVAAQLEKDCVSLILKCSEGVIRLFTHSVECREIQDVHWCLQLMMLHAKVPVFILWKLKKEATEAPKRIVCDSLMICS